MLPPRLSGNGNRRAWFHLKTFLSAAFAGLICECKVESAADANYLLEPLVQSSSDKLHGQEQGLSQKTAPMLLEARDSQGG